MDNLSCLSVLLTLTVFCAIPIYCELTLDDENYDISGHQFQDFEAMPMDKYQDVEQPKMSKGKHKLQQEEINKKQVEEVKTGKHRKIVVKMISRPDTSENEKGLYSGGQKNMNVYQKVDPDLEEDACIDDSEVVKPQTIKVPTTRIPLKREINPWNYNDLKSSSRKRNSLDSLENESNDLYGQDGQEKLDDDEEACIDEVKETKKPARPEPQPKREMNPKIKSFLKSMPRTKPENLNDTRLPKYCAHNETTVPKETPKMEEECVDEDVAVIQTDVKRQKRNKNKMKKIKRKQSNTLEDAF